GLGLDAQGQPPGGPPQALRGGRAAARQGPADHLSLPPDLALRDDAEARRLHPGPRRPRPRQGPEAAMSVVNLSSPLAGEEGARAQRGKVRGLRERGGRLPTTLASLRDEPFPLPQGESE